MPGVRLLDQSSDVDHNRTVFTFVGAPKEIVDGAHACITTALRLIRAPDEDGVHPWRGPVDVVPFVPLSGATLDDCARLARKLAERVTGVEVALYGAASPTAESLPEVRRRLRGRRDVVTIGAREALVAFNVQLESTDLDAAREIAHEVRDLPALRALAFPLKSRGCVQISMNLLDWRQTSPFAALQEVERLAGVRGIAVRDSEVVGMIPQEAVDAGLSEALRGAPLRVLRETPRFLDALASTNPAPAGASAAAYAGAMGAALVAMTVGVTGARAEAEALRQRLRSLANEDAAAFAAHLLARDEASLRRATDAPLLIAEAAGQVVQLGAPHVGKVAPPMASDLDAGLRLARTAVEIATRTARLNLSRISDVSYVASASARLDAIFSA